MLLVWERLIFPDGSSILLDSLPGTDAGGQTGVRDRVDHHLDRLIGGAALATLLGVGAELAAPNRSDTDGQIVIATRDSAQETVSEIGQQITRRNLDIQPTLTIRPGFPMRVTAHRTLALRLALGDNVEMALVAITHALAAQTFYHYAEAACFEIRPTSSPLGQHAEGIEDSEIAAKLPAPAAHGLR